MTALNDDGVSMITLLLRTDCHTATTCCVFPLSNLTLTTSVVGMRPVFPGDGVSVVKQPKGTRTEPLIDTPTQPPGLLFPVAYGFGRFSVISAWVCPAETAGSAK